MNNERDIVPVRQVFEPFCRDCPAIRTVEQIKYANEAIVELTITCKRLDTCRRAYELGRANREAEK